MDLGATAWKLTSGHDSAEVLGIMVVSQQLGQAHICQLSAVLPIQKYVAGFEVEVHNITLMEIPQCLGNI